MKEEMQPLSFDTIFDILSNKEKEDQFTTLKDLPHPELFKDMIKSTKRIVDAINNKETINIVGDYDVDGIVSTVIMLDFFGQINIDVNHIIPNRFEHGYGISPKILDMIDDGIIITVDNGIGAFEAGEICFKRKLDLIITDHHTVGDEVPKAYTIINPKQKDCKFPFDDICGAQVAWYLCASINKALKLNIDMMDFLQYLALAIVADVMPMKSMNKAMVKKGLILLNNSSKIPILALKKRFGLSNIKEDDVGFKIAPLINCASRMGDANIALEFLLSNDINSSEDLLNQLIDLNEQRKFEQNIIYTAAKEEINNNDNIVFVYSDEWNEGIIGIVASKLSEKYDKTAFVFSISGNKAKGSSRSSNINLYELISQSSSLLMGYGGHAGAAGLALDINKIEELKKELNNNIVKMDKLEVESKCMGEIRLKDINTSFYNMINSFRPFGHNFEEPLFLFENLTIENTRIIGKNNDYLKLSVVQNGIPIEILVFVDIDKKKLIQGCKIDIEAKITRNEFRGNISYELMLHKLLSE